jgi:hypothetical protein
MKQDEVGVGNDDVHLGEELHVRGQPNVIEEVRRQHENGPDGAFERVVHATEQRRLGERVLVQACTPETVWRRLRFLYDLGEPLKVIGMTDEDRVELEVVRKISSKDLELKRRRHSL